MTLDELLDFEFPDDAPPSPKKKELKQVQTKDIVKKLDIEETK